MRHSAAIQLDRDQAGGLIPIFVQFGFKKGFTGGQIVSVEVGGYAVSKDSGDIAFISNPAKRVTECWWAGKVMATPGTQVHLVTKVGIRGVGPDTERSSDQWYVVDAGAPMREVEIHGVGYKGYPLIKGQMRPVSTRSEHDVRLAGVDATLASLDD